MTTIHNRNFETVDRTLVLRNSIPRLKLHRGACVLIRRISVRRPNYSPGAWSLAADAFAYGHPFAQTGITFHSAIGITYKTPIQNRHSEALVVPLLPRAIKRRFRVKKPSFRTPKLRFYLKISPFPRFSGRNVTLDHANPWLGDHTESTYHGNRKLSSTRRENSSPEYRIGTSRWSTGHWFHGIPFRGRNCTAERVY
ncbi:hypothetical protein Taro_032000 [Colocasia esculenta]|uniref:Uncharacterized protein n=1 Tax=Colocasia esculenta TaxID=4460 RepID=A0A843W0K7_COLES|nr:hypothetical protein [Colocasia esculenta]